MSPECLIRLDADGPLRAGRHWYCDVVAAHFRERTVFLCEISYANPPRALLRRLKSWREAWPAVRAAVLRDSGAPPDWAVRPWAFVPEACVAKVCGACDGAAGGGGPGEGFPEPRVSALESALPWRGTPLKSSGSR